MTPTLAHLRLAAGNSMLRRPRSLLACLLPPGRPAPSLAPWFGAPAPSHPRPAVDNSNSPSSEREMLVFVASLAGGLVSKSQRQPWIFTEIKEQKHWDITSGERLNILKDFVHFGLEHWGSDSKGVETTRHFLLEWLSYTCRYIPVGLLDVIPQRLNWRPPSYYGRDDLETLMVSDSAADWIRISEMLLGKVPEGFTFAPKHKSNAYDRAENG
ncbi:hypothetical protein PR202_gb27401 [Eleusine coracana subsp. coracana]|uniref:Uncharacterized protein n=1 Tax=Eleusine coracana subsp. coracana TaxID=191504 RepID=A0AAV5FV89_ELECO|nr:hypothetical protein PR202_gb27401 [Eleusine coracana subsp. coracana]